MELELFLDQSNQNIFPNIISRFNLENWLHDRIIITSNTRMITYAL